MNLGIGAILGSGMIAFLIIPSCCIFFSPGPKLTLKRRPLMRDVLAYTCSLVVLILIIHEEEITAASS